MPPEVETGETFESLAIEHRLGRADLRLTMAVVASTSMITALPSRLPQPCHN
jgi:hypothetical protein